jgi:hypothetical protein
MMIGQKQQHCVQTGQKLILECALELSVLLEKLDNLIAKQEQKTNMLELSILLEALTAHIQLNQMIRFLISIAKFLMN